MVELCSGLLWNAVQNMLPSRCRPREKLSGSKVLRKANSKVLFSLYHCCRLCEERPAALPGGVPPAGSNVASSSAGCVRLSDCRPCKVPSSDAMPKLNLTDTILVGSGVSMSDSSLDVTGCSAASLARGMVEHLLQAAQEGAPRQGPPEA